MIYGDLAWISREVGVSVSHVSRCISGEREPAPELRTLLEKLFGVPLSKVDLPRAKKVTL